MPKLHLDVETLEVESFTTDEEGEGRGTVHARSFIGPTYYTYCIPCGSDTDINCGTETQDVECTRPAVCGPQPQEPY